MAWYKAETCSDLLRKGRGSNTKQEMNRMSQTCFGFPTRKHNRTPHTETRLRSSFHV